MAFRLTTVGAVLLSIFGRSSADTPHQIACLTEEACHAQSQLLVGIGVEYFAVGHLAADGCFYHEDTAYFGLGGTVESMSEAPLPRGRQRIWCSNGSGSGIETATANTTVSDTEEPTYPPTESPSFSPTLSPSLGPTTSQPTKAPSKAPSQGPSPEPSTMPSTSSAPTTTAAPSYTPSLSPSSKPTAMPSKSTTPTTSTAPSPTPSHSPSAEPTSQPSTSQTPTTTTVPSQPPSQSPSFNPTTTPTGTPSTESPTDLPTMAPVYPPTSSPSQSPTSKPTFAPSRSPTAKPTSEPSRSPTSKPTLPESSATSTTQQVVCESQDQCNLRRKELGYSRFNVGRYPAKGCFAKGGVAFFGTGGTMQQQSKEFTGSRQRIWCTGGNSNEPIDPLSPLPEQEGPVPPLPLPEPDMAAPPKEEFCIDAVVVTDKFGEETGFELTTNPEDGSAPSTLYEVEVGSLKSSTEYTKRICVEAGRYTFTVRDKVSGMCCQFGRGSYSVSVDGDELVTGGNFKTGSISHDILVGYVPEMSNEEAEWLEAHNTRRKEFHEKHNREYRSLKWSPKLADDARRWANQLAAQCRTAQEPNVSEGENVSAMRYSKESSDRESPDMILRRWVDNKAGKGFPDYLTRTQSLWRATRFVGCASQHKEMANGSHCYVSVCRYMRPGNCSIKSYGGWLPATLQEKTPCGEACPDDVCY